MGHRLFSPLDTQQIVLRVARSTLPARLDVSSPNSTEQPWMIVETEHFVYAVKLTYFPLHLLTRPIPHFGCSQLRPRGYHLTRPIGEHMLR
jgi:hypothetical protein